MAKKLTVIALAMVALTCTCLAQNDSLAWFTLSEPVGPGGSTVPYDGGDPSLGALVQLIVVQGGVAHAPVFSGTGVQTGDRLVTWTGCGYGAFDATFASQDTLVNYSLGTSSSVYVRVWDRPTSGSGSIPAAQFYAGVGTGAYYYDAPLALISALPKSGDFFQYDAGAITQPSWTFLASVVPEPSTIALGLLGLGLVVGRRLIRRK